MQSTSQATALYHIHCCNAQLKDCNTVGWQSSSKGKRNQL